MRWKPTITFELLLEQIMSLACVVMEIWAKIYPGVCIVAVYGKQVAPPTKSMSYLLVFNKSSSQRFDGKKRRQAFLKIR